MSITKEDIITLVHGDDGSIELSKPFKDASGKYCVPLLPSIGDTVIETSKVADELEPIWRLLTGKPSMNEIRKAQELIENMQSTLRGGQK